MPAQPNQSLADGIALLGILCSRDGLGSREAARLLGWEPTRTNRLLGTLRDLGLAAQDANRRYRPGAGVHILATQCLRGSGLLAAAMPVLHDLGSAEFGVALGVLWNGEVSYLVHAPAGQPASMGLSAHSLFPADHSSIGLILEAVTRAKPARNPPARLSECRRLGYAVNREPGARCGSVAVAIAGAPGTPLPVAGLAIMADLETHAPADLAARLQPASQAITDALH